MKILTSTFLAERVNSKLLNNSGAKKLSEELQRYTLTKVKPYGHLTFDLLFLTFDISHIPMDQWTSGPVDQWTNGAMDQWTNGPMEQWTNGAMEQWTNGQEILATL